MEREIKEGRNLNSSRMLTYFLIGLTILMTSIISLILLDYWRAENQNKKLENIKKQIEQENEILRHENAKLNDEDYFAIFVKDYYYYNGKIIYK